MKKLYFILIFLISIVSFALFYNFLGANDIYLLKNKIVTVVVENDHAYDGIILHAGKDYIKFQKDKQTISQKITSKVDIVELYIKKGYENKIKNIVIYNGILADFYTQKDNFSGLQKSQKQICTSNNCENYIVLTKKINNQNSCFNTLNAFLISFLSGNKIYFLSYILIFIALLFYKNSIFDFLKKRYVFILILIFALILRLNFIITLPIGDECFSISISSKFLPFSHLLNDAGNPPLYYLILRLYEYVFGLNVISYKLLNVLISIFSIYTLYFVLKKKFNLIAANLGAFFLSINLISIFYAQEIRSYELQMALTPVAIYVLFELLRSKKTKYYVLYTILCIALVNLHYFESLLIFSNFIFGIFYLSFQKRKKDILKFILSHVIVALSFMPFFLTTALTKGLIDSNFNSWIEPVSFKVIFRSIGFIFGSSVSAILFLVFFIKTVKNKPLNKTKLFCFYIFFLISTVLITSSVFSYFIKPILSYSYTRLLIPAFIMFLAIIFSKEKNRFSLAVLFIWLFFIQNFNQLTVNKRYYLNEYNVFRAANIHLKEKTDSIYIITKLSAKFYLNMPQGVAPNNAHYEFVEPLRVENLQDNIEKRIENIFKKDRNAVIFTSLLKPNEKNTKNKNYVCYYNSAIDCCIWKINNKN